MMTVGIPESAQRANPKGSLKRRVRATAESAWLRRLRRKAWVIMWRILWSKADRYIDRSFRRMENRFRRGSNR